MPAYILVQSQRTTPDLVLFGSHLGDPAHGETSPPVVGGKPRADAICTGPRSKWREGYKNKRDIPRSPILQHITAKACEDDLSEERRSAPGHSRGFRMVPNLYDYNRSRSTEPGNVASRSAAWSLGSERPPTSLPERWLWLGLAPIMAALWLEEFIDPVAIHGKRCDSVLFLASLICKHSYWWSYLPCMVQCSCKRASLIVWSFWNSESKATLCLHSRNSFLSRWRTWIAAFELWASFLWGASECLTGPQPLHRPVFLSSSLMESLEV